MLPAALRLSPLPGMRRRAPVSLAAAVLLALLASACQDGARAGEAGSGSSAPAETAAAPKPKEPRFSIAPAGGSTGVSPTAAVRVHVARGRLTGVSVRSGGRLVAGALDLRRGVWHSRWALATDRRYTVAATAVDAQGRLVSTTSAFRTLAPPQSVRTMIFEGYRQTYGVGMPIILTFSQPVEDRRAVERALELRTSKPVVGAWYWDGPSTLYFRPRSYWRPHTVVHFVGHLDGVRFAPGVYGTHTLTQTFSIGRSLISVADTSTHHIRVYLEHRLFADWPISSGKPGDDTPNGTYLTIEKHNPVEMKGPGYDLMVPWSVRFTWSGDYLHDAYWSVGQQGFENVSHGCVNLSPADAETYYQLAVPGDPVTIQGSPRGGTWDNGWTVWFLSWRQIMRGSALHRAVWAGPAGSSFMAPAKVARSWAKAPLHAPAPGNADPA